MKVNEVKVKSILTPSKLPFSDYVLNTYGGCLHGCVYCYADFMRRFTGHSEDDWGDYVDVKINAPEILSKEIIKFKKKYSEDDQKKLCIHIGSVTDCYQPIEAKYKITRECLKILRDHDIKSEISILTKSRLVLRDIDFLKELSNVSVGLTVTGSIDKIIRVIEPNSTSVLERLNVLSKLNQAGVKTYAFIGPLIPGILDSEKDLDELFALIAKSGTTQLWVELLNPRGGKINKVSQVILKHDKQLGDLVLNRCKLLNSEAYIKDIEGLVSKIAERNKLRVVKRIIKH